jgi:hypothetical protein
VLLNESPHIGSVTSETPAIVIGPGLVCVILNQGSLCIINVSISWAVHGPVIFMIGHSGGGGGGEASTCCARNGARLQ